MGRRQTVMFLVTVMAALVPAASAAAEPGALPAWGLGARVGSFGLPGRVADLVLEEHPAISGILYGGELRYYGEGGPRGVFSIGLAFDWATTSARGIWRADPQDEAVFAEGELSMAAVTLTGYFDVFPQAVVHPFIGLGFGYAVVDGRYEEDEGWVEVKEGIPAVHLPAGLAVNFGDSMTLRAEARVIDGVSFGAQLMLNF